MQPTFSTAQTITAVTRRSPRDALGGLWLLVAWLAVVAAPSAGGAPPEAPAGAGRWAEQITRENAERLRVGGSDATGGVGDWALGNGVLCAVVLDPSHESHLSPRGGALVDLARCGLAHDQWVTQEALVNMSRDDMLGASWVRAEPEREDGAVALVVGGSAEGLDVETTYRLTPDRPDVLQIETRAARQVGGSGERAFLFGEVILHGRRQLAPFTLQLDEGDLPIAGPASVGFAHPPVDPDDMIQMVQAILPANFHVLVGGDRQRPGVSYGVRMRRGLLTTATGVELSLPTLAINGESFTMQAAFARPFWLGGGSIGWLELAQTVLMDIEDGETLTIRREILVGQRSDVASVTDQLWFEHPSVRGRVSPDARLHLHTASGHPVTQVRPSESGAFSFHAPPGSYRLSLHAPGGRVTTRDFVLERDDMDLGELRLQETGRVLLPRGRTLRLVFVREDSGELARFDDDLLGFRVGTNEFRGSDYGPDVALSGSDHDPEEIQLEPGRYLVLATRGPTYDLTRASLDVRLGEVTSLQIDEPTRLIEHRGWASVDLHVHTEWSDDSTFPVERQIAAFAAEGADLLVSAEHDRVVDYAPVIRRLGLDNEITSLVGAEVTSSAHTKTAPRTAGHSNAFPLPYDPLAFRGGAPSAEGKRLRDVIAEVRALPGRPIFQLNHPRGQSPDSDLNLFSHLSVADQPFRPTAPLSASPNAVLLERSPVHGLRDLDFDLFELWNGESVPAYRASRADWYSLMLQGEHRPGVANSDSHVRSQQIAYPRTFVRVEGFDGSPASLSPEALLAALRAGRAYGTSGPILDVWLVGPDGTRAGLGDTLTAQSAALELRVDAAPWVPVSRVRVLSNGAVVYDGPIEAGKPTRTPIRFDADAFVTLEVFGEASEDYRRVVREFRPFAFTNPIFVDADADGRISAPGLPAAPLPVLNPTALD